MVHVTWCMVHCVCELSLQRVFVAFKREVGIWAWDVLRIPRFSGRD
jgi:hypothetical protein